MSMNSRVFQAILAMDSYNRGYNAGVYGLSETAGTDIGTASVIQDADDPAGTARSANFYAIAYSWNGSTVISYRGTDDPLGNVSSLFLNGDMLTGWAVGAGSSLEPQARLAVRFYNELLAQSANVILTGHSLGGGLAGYVASLYGEGATIFAHMPYWLAANDAYNLATQGLFPGITGPIYGGTEPWAPDRSLIDSVAVSDEALTILRQFDASETTLATYGASLGPVQRHSQALAVTLLYGEEQWLQEGASGRTADWKRAASFVLPSLFEDEIGQTLGRVLGAREAPGATGGAGPADQMMRAIAYSAINEGVRVFGDTGIRALFDDSSDLGKALQPGMSSTIHRSAGILSDIIVQYAGKLAIGKVLQSADATATRGVLANNGDILSVDFASSLWNKGQAHSKIVGRDELVASALSQLTVNVDASSPTGINIRSDLATGLRWYAQNAGLAFTTPGALIDKISFQISNGAFDGTVPDRSAGASSDKLSLFVAGDGNDQIAGSAADDFIYGAKGSDRITGGAGDDVLAGGEGDDTLVGGAGRDFLAGGEGQDTIDLGLQLSETGAELILVAVDPASTSERAVFELGIGGDIDRAVSIERISLTAHSDTVRVTYLGAAGGAEQPMGGLKIDFGGAPIALDKDVLDFSQAGRANATSMLFGAFTADAGVYVNLRDASNQTVNYYYDWGLFHSTGGATRLLAANANTVIGTDFDDYLVANGGRRDQGEGYSTLHGGKGDDEFVAAGWETHMLGGQGNDWFHIGAATFIDHADLNDKLFYGGIPLNGGVKQWWMEGHTAYWSPFSSLLAAFPVIGSEILYTAAALLDLPMLKFARYQIDAEGNLHMSLGWGHGGSAFLKDYHLDLDSGQSTGRIVVFEHNRDEDGNDFKSGDQTARAVGYVNLALKAGFGVSWNGFDPLVIDMDGDGLELTTEQNSSVYFEFDEDGFAERTGWVRSDDALLARDANGNGTIDNITELFGNQTNSGFTMLAAYDLNADGVIDSADAVYSELRLWRDLDGDGVSDPGELMGLAAAGVESISLASVEPAEPSQIGGNGIVRTSSITLTNGETRTIADVAFQINQTATRWLGDSTISQAAAALPELRGAGTVKDLRVAMTGDGALLNLVSAFVAAPIGDLGALKAAAEAILYAWADVDGIVADPIGSGGFDSRKLAFLEAYTGLALMPRDSNGDVDPVNLEQVEAFWEDQLERLTLRLVVQGPLSGELGSISYRADLDLLVAQSPTALSELYRGLLEDLPSDPAAALAQWQQWAPLLGAMADGMRRSDGNIVRSDYIAAQLFQAMDGAAQPLDFATLATALRIEALRVGGAADETLERGDLEGTTIYLSAGGVDTINGGVGQDVYIFGRTIGTVMINDIEPGPAGDRIRFAFHAPDEVSMERSGNDLLITVKATGETVRVVGQFAPVVPRGVDLLLSSNKGVEEIQFADGTVYEIPEIMTAVGTGTDSDDHMVGTMHSDVLIGGKGNDLLEGGDDADLYVIRAGDGQDVVRETQTTTMLRAADLMIFGDGVAPDMIAFAREGNDLRIMIGSEGQNVLIEGQFAYSVLGFNDPLALNTRIEAFGFSGFGDSWSNRDIQKQLIRSSTTDGSDVTLGFGDDDEFHSSAGDDLLIGLDGADRYHWGVGSGNDVIDEQAVYIDVKVGMGGLSLTEKADTILFGPGIAVTDVRFSRPSAAADLVVTLVSTGETLTVRDQFAGFQTGPFGAQWFDRIEWFEFEGGIRLSWQQVLGIVTTGGAGDDNLWGDLFADRLDGGAGNDLLSGKGYGDTYVFNLGYGHDTIFDDNQSLLGEGFVTIDSAPDILDFGAGITAGGISFLRSGDDITLIVGSGGDRVTLRGQNAYIHTGVFGEVSYSRIEEIRFADGTAWTWAQLNQKVIASFTTAGNDIVSGFTLADRFEASAGNDILSGGDSGDTYVFGHGSGHDIIRESVSNVLYGDEDVVEFAAGVAVSDVSLARQGNDLVITLVSTGDTLKVEGQFAFQNWFTWTDVELFRFGDGTVWTKEDVQVRLIASTAGDDELIGFATDDILDGGAGNDILRGGDGSDTYRVGIGGGNDVIYETVSNTNLAENDRLVFGPGILPSDVQLSREGDDLLLASAAHGFLVRVAGQFSFQNWFSWWDIERFEFADGTVWSDRDVIDRLTGGTSGDDHLIGSSGADLLDGKAGNDILEGRDGSDRYAFGRGYGADEIRESVSNANLAENDQLEFGPGIVLADLAFARAGADLVITIIGTQDSVTVKGQFSYQNWFTWWDIERFTFEDGTVLTKDGVQEILLRGTGGADHLKGFMTADLLDGGAGNDILEGGDGSDSYVFGRGYGNDVVREWVSNVNLAENDELHFGPDITLADLRWVRDGQDLVVSIIGATDSVRIEGQWNSQAWFTWNDIETFRFADGSSIGVAEVRMLVTVGGPGADLIVGFGGDDVITGHGGDDRLEGWGGNDLYHYAAGDGSDTIFDSGSDAGDRLLFGPGIDPAGVSVEKVATDLNDVRLRLADGSTILLDNQLAANSGIEIVEFADGTLWDDAEVARRYVLSQQSGGNDGIDGTPGADQIDAGTGNDIVRAGAGDDVVSGGAGDDVLQGDSGNDVLAGGAGLDRLTGGSGNDTYDFNLGDGEDAIFDNGSGEDTILLDVLPADILVSQSHDRNHIILRIAGTNDRLTLESALVSEANRIERVQFADGTVWTHADLVARSYGTTAGDDTIAGDDLDNVINAGAGDDRIEGRGGNDDLTGGSGNDRLLGGYGDDILTGGAGTDQLSGDGGDDVYVFGRSDGQDRVWDYGGGAGRGGFDTVQFGPDVAPADVIVTQEGDGQHLVLAIVGTTDRITLEWTMGNGDHRIEQVRFADGTVWTHADLVTRSMSDDAGNNAFSGSYDSETITGGAGNDVLRGRWGNDILIGGTGNDQMSGDGGDDTYIFARGDGQDRVWDYSGAGGWGGIDTVQFAAGIDPADIVVTQEGDGNHLVLAIAGTNDRIALEWTMTNGDHRIEQVRFADGTVWSHADLVTRSMSDNSGSNVFSGSYDPETIAGGAGNDVLRGRWGNDILIGGAGNDQMSGDDGDDTYIFARGDGQDRVWDYSGAGGRGGNDTVQFAAGIDPADIVVTQEGSGNNLVLSIAGTTDRVALEWTMSNGDHRIERVLFADGTVWTHSDLVARSMSSNAGNDSFWGSYDGETLDGGAGNDVINARGGNDILRGGAGNDLLHGSAGDDTYIFNLGDGQDVIRDHVADGGGRGTDTLSFGVGITLADLVVTQANSGTHLVIGIAGTSDHVTIEWTVQNSDQRIEQFLFADGSLKSHADILQLLFVNNGGDDIFWGSYDGETLTGGLGNDLLQGRTGADTYIYNLGDGNDVILDNGQSDASATDVLQFGAGISVSDLVVTRPPSDVQDLRLTFRDFEGSILLDNQGLSDTGIELVRFHDGSTLTAAQLLAMLVPSQESSATVNGTSANDNLWTLDGDDFVQGLAGNDIIGGGDGNDILYGDSSGLAATGPNLVVNGGFETSGTVVSSGSWGKANSSLPGWTKTNSQGFEQVFSGVGGVAATDGGYWLDLDAGGGSGSNMRIRQEIPDLVEGASYILQFDHANRTSAASGGFEVWWNGTLVLTSNATGTAMQTKTLTLVAGPGPNALEFRGTGAEDSNGASLDNVRLFATAETATVETGDDVIYGGAGHDRLYGGSGADTLHGGNGDDRLSGGAGSDTLSGGLGSDTAVFAGLRTSYSVITSGGSIQIVDNDPGVDGDDGTDSLTGVETAEFKGGDRVGLAAPIVLDLDGDGVALINRSMSSARFDWDGDGVRNATGWVSGGDGLLVLDRNGDGRVSGADELSFVADKQGARSDLEGLSAFDSDGDGRLSSSDAAWSKLLVWQDLDGDGHASSGELRSIDEAGIAAISLQGSATSRSWSWDENVVINRGSFTRTDGSSADLADVALIYEPAQSGVGPGGDLADLLGALRPQARWGFRSRWLDEPESHQSTRREVGPDAFDSPPPWWREEAGLPNDIFQGPRGSLEAAFGDPGGPAQAAAQIQDSLLSWKPAEAWPVLDPLVFM